MYASMLYICSHASYFKLNIEMKLIQTASHTVPMYINNDAYIAFLYCCCS